MLKSASTVLAASATAVLLAAPIASATNMTPLVTCVETTSSGSVAHFGYQNNESSTVTRTVAKSEGRNSWLNLVYDGPANDWSKVVDATINRGQPTTFLPGRHDKVFSVPLTGAQVSWALVGKWATATPNSPACSTDPDPDPDPQPQPQPGPDAAPAPAPVGAQSAPAPAPAVTGPPAAAAAPRVCTSRRQLTIRIRERKGQKIRSARVVFRNKTISTSRRTRDGRVVAKIDFRKLPSGRFSVQIRARLTNGTTRTYTRRYFTCKPKLAPANKLGSKTAL